MKKLVSILLCIALLICATFSLSLGASAYAVEPDSQVIISTTDEPHAIILHSNFFASHSQNLYTLGDCDLDNTVTIVDATNIQRFLADVIYLDTAQLLSADVNFDKVVDVLDITNIQRYIAQLEDEASYCGDSLLVIDNTPQMPTVEPEYLYFTNYHGWEQVYAYYWASPETELITWPGEPMEFVKVDDYLFEIYRLEVPRGADMIIFNDGMYSRSDNLPIEGKNKICFDNIWYDYYE